MSYTMSNEQELKRRLTVIEKVFNIKEVAIHGQDVPDIERYYRESSLGYRYFHSNSGAIHMALNPDGVFDRKGYYGQPDAIAKFLTSTTQRVLELASGNGFNARYLAEKHPRVKFTGIDLVGAEVKFARRRACELNNLTFLCENFQNLSFTDSSFDLIYVIESICHATDMHKALSEAYRVLRPGGLFIVVDAWQTRIYSQLSPVVQKAAMLTQQSMAVGKPWKLDEWLNLSGQVGFVQKSDEDLTAAIMPNLFRLERMATHYFALPVLARIAARTLPSRLIENAIAGYLMPLTVDAGAHTYRMIVLGRPGGQ
jgi:ubiquinone/menaquinone biosynthesis C-methylase UbiE